MCGDLEHPGDNLPALDFGRLVQEVAMCQCIDVRSEKLQKEVPGILRNFVPNFVPKFAPNFPPFF